MCFAFKLMISLIWSLYLRISTNFLWIVVKKSSPSPLRARQYCPAVWAERGWLNFRTTSVNFSVFETQVLIGCCFWVTQWLTNQKTHYNWLVRHRDQRASPNCIAGTPTSAFSTFPVILGQCYWYICLKITNCGPKSVKFSQKRHHNHNFGDL